MENRLIFRSSNRAATNNSSAAGLAAKVSAPPATSINPALATTTAQRQANLLAKNPVNAQADATEQANFAANGNQALPTVQTTPTPPKTLDAFMDVTAADKFSGELKSAQDWAKANGLTYSAGSEQQMIDNFKQHNAEDSQYLAQSQANSTEVNKIATEKAQREANAANAGTTAAFGRNLEGQTSATNPMITKQYGQYTNEYLNTLAVQNSQKQLEMSRAQTELERAQQSGNDNLVNTLRGQISNIQDSMDKLAIAKSDQEIKAKTAEADIATANLKSFTSIVDSGVTLDSAALTSIATQLNLPLATVAGYYTGADAIRNDKTLSNEQKAQEIEKLKAEAPSWGKTADMQNFEYSQKLAGPQKAEWDKLQGSGDWQLGTSNGVSGAFSKSTGVFKPFDYQQGEFSGKAGTSSDAFNVPDGTEGGQCGHFVAQYTGLNVPDTFSGKMALTDPNLKGATPQVGDVFVSSYSDSGHMGFIQSVNTDTGKVVVKDSNYVAPEKVGTHEMDISAITGLIRPKPTDTQNVSISNDVEAVLSGRNTLFNIRQTMGRTNQAAAYMQQMRDNITKIDPTFDFVASDAGGKFVSSTFYQKAISAITSVEPNIDKAVELSDQVARIGVTGVDALLQKAAVTFGNTKVSNFHEAQKLIADEIGLALGQGSVSDMKLQLGFDVTDPSVSQEVFASNMKLVKEFISNRKAALTAQRYSSPTVNGVSTTGTTTSGGETIDLDALYDQLHPAAIEKTQERGTLY